MMTARRLDPLSDSTFLATGLFARLAHAIDRGNLTEASRARAKLAALGFVVSLRHGKRARRRKGGDR